MIYVKNKICSKYVHMVTLGVSRGETLIKHVSPKIDRGREIRPSILRDISGLKSDPTYMVTTLCQVVTLFTPCLCEHEAYESLCENQVYESSSLKKFMICLHDDFNNICIIC